MNLPSTHGTRRGKSDAAGWFFGAMMSGIFACFMAYCCISIIAGQVGFLAYRDLRLRMTDIQARLDELEARNLELRTTAGALKNNADRIAREARDLGFARKGEKFIILSGLASSSQQSDAQIHSMDMLPVGDSSGLPDLVVKELSAMIGIAVIFASLVLNHKPKRKRS
jgi:cell division protein FtsB